ncbi:DUF1801 domain-containing protein [Arthrobacter sp. 260]|uniref:DUF1801 domain-containing protein n=1 Tax=Arthrobacter sp. 260 TaxID=2735314 RepID=UPI001492D217|nr:DUF1801 domain-containing protein [Arthrobacter sp. 260]NOJ59659.1 DUF1801 domain-containing protein [Arthrobacter sp. 260]
MADSPTGPTGADPTEFVAAVAHPVRRKDAETLLTLMESATGQVPVMWGPTMVGFGHYHYRYDSGRTGDALAVGFSPRSANLVLYGLSYGDDSERLLAELGKHKRGSSCIYINKLADVDLDILARLVREGYEYSTTVRDSSSAD